MASQKRVVVWHPVGDPQQMPFLRGIGDYARQRGCWTLQINPEMFNVGLADLAGWPGDGVIAALRTPDEVAAARTLRIPVVNLAAAIRETGIPRVMVDQAAMGRLAAEHFLACGLRRFAYHGEREMWYSQQRKEGFVRRLAEEGLACEVFESSTRFGRGNPWYRWMEPIEQWLRELPGPVGVLAVHDYAATILVEAAVRVGRRVPDEIAVIGVGNDTITCEFCEVPLSSVARSNREVGYRAAELLDRLMEGQPPPAEDLLVPPEGVVRRRSTEVLVVGDRHVQAAIEYLREHAAEDRCLEDLCEHLEISHRLLELRFRTHVRCTPREFVSRLRVERAKQLLAGAEATNLQQVANACGFSGVRHLRAVFKRLTGMTPGEFRDRR